MKAEQEQACEVPGMFELCNCVITKFEFVSQALSSNEPLGDEEESLSQ